MQSFIDTGPLSPSSFFNFDNAFDGGAMNNGASNGSDDGVDLFRYYMDLQAFQSKEQPSMNAPFGSNSNHSSMDDAMGATTNTTNNSPYNAFFNPSAYSNPSSSTVSPSLATATSSQPSISQREALQPTAGSASLFPFAEASELSSMGNATPYNINNPSSMLSFDHLAGSENPQPIDPHLLMGNHNDDTTPTLPAVKEEEDVDNSSSFFPLSTPLPLSAAAPSNHTQAQAQAQANTARATSAAASSRRSASAMLDDSMNGIDGLSDDSQSDEDDDDDHDHDEEQQQITSRKRGSAATSTSNKKRTSATKSSSSSKKTSSQSKKESSILSNYHSQTHPHALVPVPEWEDRPSKAEYEKLSSKEKRQMRNKISARNFRHRRKAHIDTLEALVADKDGQIRVLSEEVGTLRTENQGLRADIEVLKKNWESIAAKIGASASTSHAPVSHQQQHLTPDEDDLYGAPGSLPALSPAASSSAESTNGDHLSELSFEQARGAAQSQAQTQASQARPSTSASSSNGSTTGANGKRVTRSSIQRPNMRKDLGPSGASFSAFGVGRSMNVHTTLIPELNFNFPIPPPTVFSSSPPTSSLPALTDASTNSASSARTSPYGMPAPLPPSSSSSAASIADMLAGKRDRDANANARLNMNPALNGLSQEQINNLREQFFNANGGGMLSSQSTENDIAGNVSGKSARIANGLDPLQSSFFDTNPFISLRQDNLQDYRAQLYAKLANNVAGIHQAQQQQNQQQSSNKGSNQQSMTGLRPAFFANQPIPRDVLDAQQQQQQDPEVIAKIASIAQKTLFDKLSTAFWDAFAGNNTPATKSLIPSDSAMNSSRRNSRATTTGAADGQQVADVIAGRSRLQIVKNEMPEDDDLDALARQVQNLGLKK